MTKSELIERLADKMRQVPAKDVESSIKEMLEQMLATDGWSAFGVVAAEADLAVDK